MGKSKTNVEQLNTLPADLAALSGSLGGKQAALVSGVNIKTVNGNSLLGSGDLVIAGGGGSGDVVGPASATDGAVALFDGATGKLLKVGGTLGTAASRDVAAAGNASTAQVVLGTDTRLTNSRPASDVSSWAKAATKPTYTKSEVGLGNVDNTSDASKSVLSATKLTTARTINGVSFDGTANITVADSTKLPLTGGTVTGELISSSANSFRMTQGSYGTFWRNDGTNTYLMVTASGDPNGTYTAARPFSMVNATGVASINGNAGTATKLATARTLTIGSTGKSFDGSAALSWSLAEIGAAPTTTPTITGLREVSAALPANNIDLGTGNVFTKTISGASTLTVSNVPAAGAVASFILELTNPGTNVTFWAGVKWPGGTAPTLTAAGVDVLGFYTRDGGTTWRGMVLAKDSK